MGMGMGLGLGAGGTIQFYFNLTKLIDQLSNLLLIMKIRWDGDGLLRFDG